MIRKFLDLSNAHLTQATCEALYGNQIDILAWMENTGDAQACFVYVPGTPTDPGEVGDIPADLIACLAYARSQGCDRIMFDNDGDKTDALPTYEW
jgi:hypothetical protein